MLHFSYFLFLKVSDYKFCEPGKGCYVTEVTNSWNPIDRSDVCGGHYPRKFIFECHITCLCGANCGNKLVQKGLSLSLDVFWTGNRGWGLRTLEPILKGTFVLEYSGEICTNKETMRRAATRPQKTWYTLNLDAEWRAEAASNDKTALFIDGLRYGNVARFLNHQCEDANLVDMPVRITRSDRGLYHVAFFAFRDIEPYEELTWGSEN